MSATYKLQFRESDDRNVPGTTRDAGQRSDIDVAGQSRGEFHERNLGLRARSGDSRRATRSRGAPSGCHLAPVGGTIAWDSRTTAPHPLGGATYVRVTLACAPLSRSSRHHGYPPPLEIRDHRESTAAAAATTAATASGALYEQ